MTTTSISNSDDVIDSRDIIYRIEYLTPDTWTCPVCGNEITTDVRNDDQKGHADDCEFEGDPEDGLDNDDRDELRALLVVQEQAEGYGDWENGETLISELYFEDYARQLAEDLGYIKHDAQWPYTWIDWSRACQDLKQDYMAIDFDGVEFWMRA
jgi:hypothetical protein